jgi:hypothetical protein
MKNLLQCTQDSPKTNIVPAGNIEYAESVKGSKIHLLTAEQKNIVAKGGYILIIGIDESVKRLKLQKNAGISNLLDSSKANTNQAATGYYKLCFYFLGLIGDYDSMHILSEDNIRNPPAISLHSLTLLLQFKDASKRDLDLIDHETNRVVSDIEGNIIKCIGGWNSDQAFKSFSSFVSVLHKKFGH